MASPLTDEKISCPNFSLRRDYFLYVGGYDERKNVEMLVKAYLSDIAPEYDVNLVLAGGKSLDDRLYESFDNLTNMKNSTSLTTTGFVDENDFPALYQSSFAFLNLSKKEGFNLPIIEALLSGQYQIFIYDAPKVSLNTTLNLLPSVTNFGRIRSNFDIDLNWEIFIDFYWVLSFYFNYDNKPTTTASETDYRIETSFKYEL